jgi:hypothetical protein
VGVPWRGEAGKARLVGKAGLGKARPGRRGLDGKSWFGKASPGRRG